MLILVKGSWGDDDGNNQNCVFDADTGNLICNSETSTFSKVEIKELALNQGWTFINRISLKFNENNFINNIIIKKGETGLKLMINEIFSINFLSQSISCEASDFTSFLNEVIQFYLIKINFIKLSLM